MSDNFKAGIDFIWRFDGYKDDSAPGENFRTSYGITEMTWNSAVKDGIAEGAFEDMTEAQAQAIYRVRFWNAIHCSEMPPGVDVMLFSSGTLAGVGHAVRFLQRIIGARVDGVVGPETIRKAGTYGVQRLIDALATADEDWFKTLGKPQFLRGWNRRTEECRQLAYELAGITPQLSPAPPAPERPSLLARLWSR